jgi:hypothetical protein
MLQPGVAKPAALNQIAGGQDRQNLANAMLAAVAGLLMPSRNRYPLGPLQRLGAGLGAALETYNEAPGRVIYGLGASSAPYEGGAFDGAAARSARGFRPKALGGTRASGSRVNFAPEGRRIARRLTGPAKAQSAGSRLRKFNGTVARRLDHPAVLPGGWQLYGYEKESGNPIYAGPDSQLRIYA